MFSERTSKILMWIGILLFIIGIIIFIWNDTVFQSNGLLNSEKVGQFGDFVGGLIGSLWAFAGLILFYVALKEQRIDLQTNKDVLVTQVQALEKQIEEFELQRKELQLTRDIFKEQRDTLRLQQFESTFFNMVNLHHRLVDSIDVTTEKLNDFTMEFDKETLTSRDCFKYFYQKYIDIFKIISKKNDDCLTSIRESYLKFYIKYQSDLGHYFRNLYNIVKFIHKSNPNNKYYYSNLLRAQLSSFELIMLFYNCLSQFGDKKFKPLIEEYHLLQNMPKNPLINKTHLRLYNKSAFGTPTDDHQEI